MYQVDAFTSTVFSGNPAAVCLLDTWLDDTVLQAVAAENNLSETAFLVQNTTGFIENLGEFFKTVGLVIPMPPSKNRTVQPLTLLAEAVAKKLDKPFFEKILVKNITTPLMKDLVTKEDKENALKGALSINDEITNDGKWDFLIIDDLYSSGASLGVATDILKTYNKVNNIYVGAFSRTR